MLLCEVSRCAIAVGVALSGARTPERLCRFARCQVLFPDIGFPRATFLGFLRYEGERSFVVPEATERELSLLPGLTI